MTWDRMAASGPSPSLAQDDEAPERSVMCSRARDWTEVLYGKRPWLKISREAPTASGDHQALGTRRRHPPPRSAPPRGAACL